MRLGAPFAGEYCCERYGASRRFSSITNSNMRDLLLENYHDDLATAIRGLKVAERPRPVP